MMVLKLKSVSSFYQVCKSEATKHMVRRERKNPLTVDPSYSPWFTLTYFNGFCSKAILVSFYLYLKSITVVQDEFYVHKKSCSQLSRVEATPSNLSDLTKNPQFCLKGTTVNIECTFLAHAQNQQQCNFQTLNLPSVKFLTYLSEAL